MTNEWGVGGFDRRFLPQIDPKKGGGGGIRGREKDAAAASAAENIMTERGGEGEKGGRSSLNGILMRPLLILVFKGDERKGRGGWVRE